jgi:hypothetical protein
LTRVDLKKIMGRLAVPDRGLKGNPVSAVKGRKSGAAPVTVIDERLADPCHWMRLGRQASREEPRARRPAATHSFSKKRDGASRVKDIIYAI